MRYTNLTLFYFATPLVFNAPGGEFPWDYLCKILHRGQTVAKVQNGGEILPKVLTP